ncbi:MAG: sialidase family protein, partial [Thermodesulfovibrionales bacterium]
MKKGLKILFSLLLLFSLLPSSLYADLIDVIVDRGNANVSNPQIVADGYGHVYAVWEDTRNGNSDIYFNYSSDYGFTWQASDIRLDTDSPGANNSNSPKIACDNSGHVYVVWQDSRNGTSDIYFNVSSNYGATWLSSDIKLNNISSATTPQIACDNSGHVYVVWNNNYFNTSSDYGVNWLSNPVQISTSGGTETQISCDYNGHVYIAWITPIQEVLFNYSTDYGNTWQSTDRIVNTTGAIPDGLSLDNDNNGHVYIAWHDGRNNPESPDIYFNSSSDYGNTWGASDIRLNTGAPGSTYSIWPEVASDESGHVYVTWYDRRNGLGDIYINSSSDYGMTWLTSDIRLDTDTPGSSDSGYPKISCDNSGHIYITWS